MSETSPRRRSRRAGAWSAIARAAAHTLSAVPMSTRLTLRWAGTVGRWMTPGVNTSGRPDGGERARQRPQPADAAALAVRGEEREPEIRRP